MPPKRKPMGGPVSECPITGFPIDERLKKRLKGSSSVTVKTISNALQSNFGEKVSIGAGVEIDGLIDVYYETLLAHKASSPGPAAVSVSASPAPPPRGKKSAEAAPAPAPAPAPPSPAPPSKPAPRRVSARAPPVEDIPSPQHVSAPRSPSPSPFKAKNEVTKAHAKKASSSKAAAKGGPSVCRAVCWLMGIMVLVALVLVAAVSYGGPGVQKMLPPALAQHLQAAKQQGGQLQLAGVESAVKEHYNWISIEAEKLGKKGLLYSSGFGNAAMQTVEGWIAQAKGGAAAAATPKMEEKKAPSPQEVAAEAERVDKERRRLAKARRAAAEQRQKEDEEREAKARIPEYVEGPEGSVPEGVVNLGGGVAEPEQQAVPKEAVASVASEEDIVLIGGTCEEFNMFDCSAQYEYGACLKKKDFCEWAASQPA